MVKPDHTHLDDALTKALNRRKSQSTIRRLTTPPPNSVDFSSNDFLSLATSRELRELYIDELHKAPSITRLGSGGSRLLDGNSSYAEQLERDIANFHRAEAGLLCNSGFDANVGLFSCLPQPGDLIVYDEFIHASVHDGMRLSRAGQKIAFAHNSPHALEQVLDKVVRADDLVKTGHRNVFIAVEAVYSMDGDVAPLREIIKIVRHLLPLGNGHVVVDEAHSNGVLGLQGRGLVCGLGLEDEVSVRLHTFGKALACNGAILLCSPLIRQYLVNYARPLIYTTFLSYPALAAIRASYTYLQSGKTDQVSNLGRRIQTPQHDPSASSPPTSANQLTTSLNNLTTHLHALLQDLISNLPSTTNTQHPLLSIPSQAPQSPIFSLLTPKPKQLALHCQSKGFIVRGIVPPTVPLGGERVRICLHAGNTSGEVRALVRVIEVWAREQMRAGEMARL